ncbi:hypothetical protein KAR91_82735 [Candidatus Pacearchaeota archaeon]|nr:hypothetical protein [Candidatus Pacearchaeota archaeon]
MTKLIAYIPPDGKELIVTTLKKEKETIEKFIDCTSIPIEDYTRKEFENMYCFCLQSDITIW